MRFEMGDLIFEMGDLRWEMGDLGELAEKRGAGRKRCDRRVECGFFEWWGMDHEFRG
jgi:hypothetical protein